MIFANASDKNVLQALNIQNAQAIIITTLNEIHTHLITENVLALNPNIKIIVVSEDMVEREFYKNNKVVVIDKNREIAKQIIYLLGKINKQGKEK